MGSGLVTASDTAAHTAQDDQAGRDDAAAKPDPVPARPASAAPPAAPDGLSGAQARDRLKASGPNTIADTALHPLRRALDKFWAPVPWMLEGAIVLELALGKLVEAAIIAGPAGI